jgi:hypothetical protein
MTTVKEVWKMACPRCGDDSTIDITASIDVRLCVDGTDADATRCGDHEWGDDSPVTCGCGHEGIVNDFTIPDA